MNVNSDLLQNGIDLPSKQSAEPASNINNNINYNGCDQVSRVSSQIGTDMINDDHHDLNLNNPVGIPSSTQEPGSNEPLNNNQTNIKAVHGM